VWCARRATMRQSTWKSSMTSPCPSLPACPPHLGICHMPRILFFTKCWMASISCMTVSLLCSLQLVLDSPQCIGSVSAGVECRCDSVFLWQIAGLVQGASPKGRAPRAKGRQALRGQSRAQQQRNSRNSPPSSARKQRKMYALATVSKLTSLHSQHSAYTHPCLPKLLLSSYQAAV
jgi:hypothetical protein